MNSSLIISYLFFLDVKKGYKDKNMYSFIIPYRIADQHRMNNLKFQLNWLINIHQLDFEFLMVEQDSEPKTKNFILEKYPCVKYLFNYAPDLFQKSLACNVGVKHCKHDNIILCDLDTAFHPITLFKALKILHFCDTVKAFNNVYYLDETATNIVHSFSDKSCEFPNIKSPNIYRSNKSRLGGAMTIIKKNAYWKIRGFDEEFHGHGCQDMIFAYKCFKFLKKNGIPGKMFHMRHPTPKSDKHYSRKKYNKMMYYQLKNMSRSQWQKRFDDTPIEKLGNIDKYKECETNQ